MKYLLFIVLLVAVVITAGCVSENKNTVVTPIQTTPAPTTIVTTTVPTTIVTNVLIVPTTFSKEPIVGKWEYRFNSGTLFYTWSFKPDGTFWMMLEGLDSPDYGDWRKIGENQYETRFYNDSSIERLEEDPFIYIPQTDTLTHDVIGITTRLHRI